MPHKTGIKVPAPGWMGAPAACQQWFADLRHRLRHGHEQHVLAELAALVEATPLPQSARQTLINVYTYLKTHEDHDLDTTWKVSSFAGRQSLRLSGWHQHLQYFITGFALGKISLAYFEQGAQCLPVDRSALLTVGFLPRGKRISFGFRLCGRCALDQRHGSRNSSGSGV